MSTCLPVQVTLDPLYRRSLMNASQTVEVDLDLASSTSTERFPFYDEQGQELLYQMSVQQHVITCVFMICLDTLHKHGGPSNAKVIHLL